MTAPTVERLRSITTCSVREGGAFLGLSTASAYRAANDGTLPTIRVGKTIRVPTPKLLALVGLEYENETAPDADGTDHDHPSPAPTNQTDGQSHEQAHPGSTNQRLHLRPASA